MILYGAFYMITYYSQFSVPIVQYISFSEIISFFIKDLLTVFGTAMLLAFVVYINVGERKIVQEKMERDAERYNTLEEKLKDEMDKSKRSILHAEFQELDDKYAVGSTFSTMAWIRKRIVPIVLVLIFLVSGLTMLYIFTPLEYLKAFLLSVGISLTVIVCSFVFHDFKLAFLVTITISLILFSFVSAWLETLEVKSGKNFGVSFSLKSTKTNIGSDSTNYFIGKTEEFIFFYKSKEKRTIVYRMEDVDTLSIPNK